MRNKTSLFKRSLAGLLTLVLVLGMIPAMSWVAKAAEGDDAAGGETGEDTGTSTGQQTNITGNYITLPITIRDYAADGMLFEYNEVNRYNLDDEEGATKYIKTDRIYQAGGAAYSATYNSSTMGTTEDLSQGIFVMSYDQDLPAGVTGQWFYCLLVGQYGDILKVIPAGEEKDYENAIDANYGTADAPVYAYYSVWAWRSPKNVPYYSLLAKVTESNKSQYRVALSYDSTAGYQIYLGRRYFSNVAPSTYGNKGIFVIGGDQIGAVLGADDALEKYYLNWHVVITDSSNRVVKVIPNGTSKTGLSGYFTSGYKIVMAWSDGTNRDAYDYITAITPNNYTEYQIVPQVGGTFGAALFVERTIYVNEADTRGFGLLFTDGEDYLNWIGDDESDAQNLPGSKYVSNNTGSTIEADLWDKDGTVYAKQDVYGAGIRTNLVGKELDPVTGKPVYTESTITFLAKYLQEIMQVPLYNETDNDYGAAGTYNSYHVMGTKLFVVNPNYVANPGPEVNPLDNFYFNYVGPTPEATHDLAAVFRHTVGNAGNNLGSYEASKAKFESRLLLFPQQATTWFDAAYYLLNMLWDDSPIDNRTGTAGQDGYGMPISNYNRIHLVQTTNADGQICYVFNAKYDGTTYDYSNGEIFNSHFPEGTNTETRTYSPAYTRAGATESIYGNILPAARFDPIGPGGSGVNRGYTMSGNTYGDFAQNDTINWAEYYQETNYNLTLEGHAEFVYHQDANQYFIFTGDDDVYLYINGIRVLDLGGAHSIAKVGINLNDVAESCGLKDGDTYRFDFFYTERHGTAANFGIETNIQIADTSMVTTKTGYQNGMSTGYNGFVDPTKPVAYSFSLKNNGLAPIYNLTFDDPDIGTHFSWNEANIVLNSYTDINDMYLYRFNADGTVKSSIQAGKLTTADISRELKAGLPVGETIAIYGFKYDIEKEQKWTADGNFLNTVTTSATKTTATDQDATLHGVADWMVQRSNFSFKPFHVYEWVHKELKKDWESQTKVTLSKRELLQYFVTEGKINEDQADALAENADVKIIHCTASGGYGEEYEYYLNDCVTVNDDGSITYEGKEPGMDTVFYMVQGTGIGGNNAFDTVVLNYDVFAYGTANNVYVLDYGLAVELNCDQYGFRVNDKLEIPQNTYKPALTMDIKPTEQHFGSFDANGTNIPLAQPIKYTPSAIINGADNFVATFHLYEEGVTADTVTKYNGIAEMKEIVSTVPANVVYYEENFPGITYVNTDKNNWIHYETMNGGQSQAGTTQSPNQDTNYGSDPNYETDKSGSLESSNGDKVGTVVTQTVLTLKDGNLDDFQADAIEAMNQQLGLGGADSNGTVNQLVLKETLNDLLYFEFRGTGFEIVSRTTANEYAVVTAMVYKKDDAGNFTKLFRILPVITESKGGTLYQVPIISITGMPRDDYRVVLQGGTNGNKTRVLYIDGIRIYEPLEDDQVLNYYNTDEAYAQFLEVKQLIQDGRMIYADYSATPPADAEYPYPQVSPLLVTGTTMVENTNLNYPEIPGLDPVLQRINSSEQYMSVGPNNELYLNADGTNSMIAFYVSRIEYLDDAKTMPYPNSARTLEIGAHRKADSQWSDSSYIKMTFGTEPDHVLNGTYSHVVSSGTEQYYTIDVEKLIADAQAKAKADAEANGTEPPVDTGKYLIMIGTNDAQKTSLALTNIKVAGYEIYLAENAINVASDSGNLGDEPIVYKTFRTLMGYVEAQEPEVDQTPVNENLHVDSASLITSQIVPGKNATINVVAKGSAQRIVITDSEGNEITPTQYITRTVGNHVLFNVSWPVYGNRGEQQTFTIRVYDENNLASVNKETVTVTFK